MRFSSGASHIFFLIRTQKIETKTQGLSAMSGQFQAKNSERPRKEGLKGFQRSFVMRKLMEVYTSCLVNQRKHFFFKVAQCDPFLATPS